MKHVERGKPVFFFIRVQYPPIWSRPPVREGNENAGRGCGKKRMLHCNGEDKGLSPDVKACPLPMQVCLNDNDGVNPNGGSVYNER